MLKPGAAVDTDGSAGGGGRLPSAVQPGQTAQPVGLREPGGVCDADLSIPTSGRATPSLRWEWTRNRRKHRLKPVLGLTLDVDQKVESGHRQSNTGASPGL